MDKSYENGRENESPKSETSPARLSVMTVSVPYFFLAVNVLLGC